MPVPQPINAGSVLTAGIRSNFIDAFSVQLRKANAKLPKVMQLGLPSDKLTEIFAYFQAAPHARRWPRGEAMPAAAMSSRQFSVTNFDYGIFVPYHTNDVADDQTGSLIQRARDAGTSLGLLEERLFFQVLTGAADSQLLTAIPVAADGAALFATTAGGLNRFGVANGNLLTGAGVVTVAALHTDLYAAIAQAMQFQDGQGQPLLPTDLIMSGITVICGAGNFGIFDRAFNQRNNLQIVQNVAAAENVAAATPSNPLLDSGLNIDVWPTPRITDNDWFIAFSASGAIRPAVFSQLRQAIEETIMDRSNSDQAKLTKMGGLGWDVRLGIGVQEAFSIVQINN